MRQKKGRTEAQYPPQKERRFIPRLKGRRLSRSDHL
jgi:hypothetical protein